MEKRGIKNLHWLLLLCFALPRCSVAITLQAAHTSMEAFQSAMAALGMAAAYAAGCFGSTAADANRPPVTFISLVSKMWTVVDPAATSIITPTSPQQATAPIPLAPAFSIEQQQPDSSFRRISAQDRTSEQSSLPSNVAVPSATTTNRILAFRGVLSEFCG